MLGMGEWKSTTGVGALACVGGDGGGVLSMYVSAHRLSMFMPSVQAVNNVYKDCTWLTNSREGRRSGVVVESLDVLGIDRCGDDVFECCSGEGWVVGISGEEYRAGDE
jgi:hypothetical protein